MSNPRRATAARAVAIGGRILVIVVTAPAPVAAAILASLAVATPAPVAAAALAPIAADAPTPVAAAAPAPVAANAPVPVPATVATLAATADPLFTHRLCHIEAPWATQNAAQSMGTGKNQEARTHRHHLAWAHNARDSEARGPHSPVPTLPPRARPCTILHRVR